MDELESISDYLKNVYTEEELKNIVEHGCVNGAACMHIYYHETVAFYEVFEDQIWDIIYIESKDMGISQMEYITSLNGQKDIGSMDQLKNLLCWFAIEHKAREILGE
jgi:hypothetical protein